MPRSRLALVFLSSLSLLMLLIGVAVTAWSFLHLARPETRPRPAQSAQAPRSVADEGPDFGPVPPDDYGLNVEWMNIDAAQAQYTFDLPDVIPDGYEELDKVRVEKDTLGDGWMINVYYENPELDDDTGVVLTITDDKYYASTDDPSYDPLDDLMDGELGWSATGGGYRFLMTSDPDVTDDDLHDMMCSMASYDGDDCSADVGDRVG